VIVEQASRLLVNYPLQLAYVTGTGPRLALWGHGKDFRRHRASRLGEWAKRVTSRHVHWWFAYNERSAAVVRGLGFPTDRITNVQNAIDTRQLAADRAAVTTGEVTALRARLGLVGDNVCIYAGGMYFEKRLEFLLRACVAIRERIPDFEVIFVGAGDDAHLVQAAARRHPWIKYVGPRFGRDKALHFAASKLLLMPGLVGLAVLDGFALECPIVTTDVAYHSPEIEYLVHDVNGIVTSHPDSVEEYASATADLLMDDGRLEALRAGCRDARSRYTIENMVLRFANGVQAALAWCPGGGQDRRYQAANP
jgi:glycosyltransferase involved in cell wall biosynthesis